MTLRISGQRRVASVLDAGAYALSGLDVRAGQLLVPDGTLAAPGLAFRDDVDTGIRRGGPDILEVSAGATLGLRNSQFTQYVGGSTFQINGAIQTGNAFIANTPHTTQSITAAATAIAVAYSVVPISSTGAFTLSAAPTLGNGVYDGQLCEVVNVGTFDITLQDQGTLALSNLRLGAATRTLTPRDSITLRYLTSVGDWVETGFSTVI